MKVHRRVRPLFSIVVAFAFINFVLVMAALAVVLASCGPAPSSTPTRPAQGAAATSTPRPTATTPPTAAPSPTPWLGKLPEGTILLYGAGSQESRRLYALAADGSSTDLGRTVVPPAIASPSGRWVAAFDAPGRHGAVVVYDLQEGGAYTVPCSYPHGCAVLNRGFDREESYLAFTAFTELGGWALVLVDLRDGSTRRFEQATTAPQALLPGVPLGWSAAGELLWDSFKPETEGGCVGVWGLDLPPDAAPAPIDTVARRPLVLTPWSLGRGPSPEGEHLVDRYCDPRLSPDGTRLLFLARDLAYMPADYEPPGYDLAMNQLWTLDLASGEASCLVDVRDGGWVGPYADWSPDGREILFAQGRYAGDRLWPATLKVREEGGTLREIGPMPQFSYWASVDWCRPGTAVLATHIADTEDMAGVVGSALYTVDPATGRTTQVAEAPFIQVLGCVR